MDFPEHLPQGQALREGQDLQENQRDPEKESERGSPGRQQLDTPCPAGHCPGPHLPPPRSWGSPYTSGTFHPGSFLAVPQEAASPNQGQRPPAVQRRPGRAHCPHVHPGSSRLRPSPHLRLLDPSSRKPLLTPNQGRSAEGRVPRATGRASPLLPRPRGWTSRLLVQPRPAHAHPCAQ